MEKDNFIVDGNTYTKVDNKTINVTVPQPEKHMDIDKIKEELVFWQERKQFVLDGYAKELAQTEKEIADRIAIIAGAKGLGVE